MAAVMMAPAATAGSSRPRTTHADATPGSLHAPHHGIDVATPSLVIPTSATTQQPITLDQIMAMVRAVQHVDARYVEHRYLHILTAPIVTRGALRFDAPDRLEKIADPNAAGSGETLKIDGDRLTISRGGDSAPVVIAMHEHPEIAVLAGSIRATLSGDGAALQRTFDVTPSGTPEHWQLVLEPRDPAERKLLQWMRVEGYGSRITAIDTADGDGDRSKMNIVEETAGQTPGQPSDQASRQPLRQPLGQPPGQPPGQPQ
ncbi:LolA-related protein [Rhodopila sp.]|uniref:LolA-related protein n=1 Tax=Rhodopila sp. TaxID=2480087 RepID=UPI002D7EAF38|nr:LolA-related protein [Rhodopila sp.]